MRGARGSFETAEPNILICIQKRRTKLTSLSVGRGRVSPPLVSREVDERELPVERLLHVRVPEDDLEHGVRARGVGVGRGLAGGADVVAVVDQLEHVLHAVDHLLGEADDHHLLLAVLEHAQLGLAGEQVEDLVRIIMTV